jgi:hypothetical protein
VLSSFARTQQNDALFKRLSVSWDDHVTVDLLVSNRNWSRIIRGDKVSIRGMGYHYGREFICDYWDFSGGIDGALIVRCESATAREDFIGTPRQALVE